MLILVMHLSNLVRLISGLLELVCNTCHVGWDASKATHWIVGVRDCWRQIRGVDMDRQASALKRRTRWRTDFVHIIPREFNAFSDKFVDVWGAHFRCSRPVGRTRILHVCITQIIGDEDYDMWTLPSDWFRRQRRTRCKAMRLCCV